MEAYDSQARSDAKSWIGEPIQKVAKRFGQPDSVSSGDAGKTKYVWKEYENYSNDYNYTYYEQGQGMTPNSTVQMCIRDSDRAERHQLAAGPQAHGAVPGIHRAGGQRL